MFSFTVEASDILIAQNVHNKENEQVGHLMLSEHRHPYTSAAPEEVLRNLFTRPLNNLDSKGNASDDEDVRDKKDKKVGSMQTTLQDS
ncbi:jg5162 [Pararge aegeria aegeria]|uniref:Jg5162 protein n=1 Tax=Pararge aegeria aegeria TaxID=348720 RepID=A0A8S4S4C7_9NEOP|nr:jg5162 [Pararge aegeria aegeria]